MRKHFRIGIFAVAAALCITGFAIQQYSARKQYQVYLQNMVSQSMFELVGSLNTVQSSISKLLVAGSPEQSALLLTDIVRQTDRAQTRLGMIPLDVSALTDTMQFVNQVGDYCRSLQKQIEAGRPMKQEDLDQLSTLQQRSVQLGDALNDTVTNKVQLTFALPNMRGQGPATSPEEAAPLDQSGLAYPTLLYDGPYSDAAQDRRPKALPNEWIDYYRAVNIATAYVGEQRVRELAGEAPLSGDVPAWGVQLITHEGDKIGVQVTKQGGKVIFMLQETGTFQPIKSLEECRESAETFLRTRGFEGMVPSYSQSYSGVAVFNYAASQNGVVLYPDLVKVQVSMQSGEVIGVEARNYVFNHVERLDLTPTLTPEEAQQYVPQLEIDHVRLCLIPIDGGLERLCYEVSGMSNNERYLVYINAKTGDEENILQVIDVEGGQLTM